MKSLYLVRTLVVIFVVAFVMFIAHDAFSQWAPSRVPRQQAPAATPSKAPATATKIIAAPSPPKTPASIPPAPAATSLNPPEGTIPSVPATPTITAAPVAPVTMSPMRTQCDDLPTAATGGDLRFNEMRFFAVYAGTGLSRPYYLYISGAVSTIGSVDTHGADRIGDHIRIVRGDNLTDFDDSSPRGPISSKDYCKSWWGEMPFAEIMFWPVVGDIKIILDPKNEHVEENESNNMIHCTSFEIMPRDADRSVYHLLPMGRGLDFWNNSYEGPCTAEEYDR